MDFRWNNDTNKVFLLYFCGHDAGFALHPIMSKGLLFYVYISFVFYLLPCFSPSATWASPFRVVTIFRFKIVFEFIRYRKTGAIYLTIKQNLRTLLDDNGKQFACGPNLPTLMSICSTCYLNVSKNLSTSSRIVQTSPNTPGNIIWQWICLHLLSIVCIKNIQTLVKFPDYRPKFEIQSKQFAVTAISSFSWYKDVVVLTLMSEISQR